MDSCEDGYQLAMCLQFKAPIQNHSNSPFVILWVAIFNFETWIRLIVKESYLLMFHEFWIIFHVITR
jgi:hypothetical protein